ncbi:MAG TPA: tetratricopeptide repeat protein [Bryobacteraceae bacterium]|nr:tetratricopeptide repeat protein [Bryobacteraceae bacterium]
MKRSVNIPKQPEKSRPAATPKAAAAAPATWSPAWWHWALGFVLVLFVAFEVYGPALKGEFLFDDSYLPFFMVGDGPFSQWMGVRPFLMISYWLNYKTTGLDPYPYHAVNVVFHAVNGILAGLVVRRVLAWTGETGWKREALAAFSGALFLLHPVQTESVAYVASRSEAMSIFFFLSAFAVFVYRRDTAASLGRAIAVLLLFGIACTVKEHTTVLPALLLLTDYFVITPFAFTAIRKNWKLYGMIVAAAVVGLAAVAKVLAGAQTAGFKIKEFTWYEYLFTQFRVIWLYLRLYVAPFGQSADYEFSISRSIVDGGSMVALLGLVALAVVAWWYRRAFPLAALGYFGFLILLAPTSSVVPIRDVAVERRLYLPFICLLFITVDFLRRWTVARGTMIGILSAVCVVAGGLSYQRNHVWGSALALWTDTVEKAPGNARAVFQLAHAQWLNGQCGQAAATYERVSKMDKIDERLLIDWALALECANRVDEAAAKIRQAMQAQPTAHGYSQLGMIYGKHARANEALEALAMAEKLDPRFEMTYVYRGNVYASRGEMPQAVAEYQRALALNPNSAQAQQGLAAVQLRR